jgi:hypothetical protein
MHTHSPPSAQALPRETSAHIHTCTHACAQRRWNRPSLLTFGHTHTHTHSLSLSVHVCAVARRDRLCLSGNVDVCARARRTSIVSWSLCCWPSKQAAPLPPMTCREVQTACPAPVCMCMRAFVSLCVWLCACVRVSHCRGPLCVHVRLHLLCGDGPPPRLSLSHVLSTTPTPCMRVSLSLSMG